MAAGNFHNLTITLGDMHLSNLALTEVLIYSSDQTISPGHAHDLVLATITTRSGITTAISRWHAYHALAIIYIIITLRLHPNIALTSPISRFHLQSRVNIKISC